jgi:hypothetical protein
VLLVWSTSSIFVIASPSGSSQYLFQIRDIEYGEWETKQSIETLDQLEVIIDHITLVIVVFEDYHQNEDRETE